jgi:hypothetical protein
LSVINQTKSLNEMSIFGKVMQALLQAGKNNSSWDNIRGKNPPSYSRGEYATMISTSAWWRKMPQVIN